jgi:hypothetical protein
LIQALQKKGSKGSEYRMLQKAGKLSFDFLLYFNVLLQIKRFQCFQEK